MTLGCSNRQVQPGMTRYRKPRATTMVFFLFLNFLFSSSESSGYGPKGRSGSRKIMVVASLFTAASERSINNIVGRRMNIEYSV